MSIPSADHFVRFDLHLITARRLRLVRRISGLVAAVCLISTVLIVGYVAIAGGSQAVEYLLMNSDLPGGFSRLLAWAAMILVLLCFASEVAYWSSRSRLEALGSLTNGNSAASSAVGSSQFELAGGIASERCRWCCDTGCSSAYLLVRLDSTRRN